MRPTASAEMAGRLPAFSFVSLFGDLSFRLLDVVSNNLAPLHDKQHMVERIDVRKRIAGHSYYVGILSLLKDADAILPSQQLSRVTGSRADDLYWRQTLSCVRAQHSNTVLPAGVRANVPVHVRTGCHRNALCYGAPQAVGPALKRLMGRLGDIGCRGAWLAAAEYFRVCFFRAIRRHQENVFRGHRRKHIIRDRPEERRVRALRVARL